MARHILAACVVCLLCADHLPCQQHFESIPSPSLSKLENVNSNVFRTSKFDLNDNLLTAKNNNNNNNYNEKLQDINSYKPTIKDLENHPRLQADFSADIDPLDPRNPYKNQIPYQRLSNSQLRNLRRQRRHAGHDHGDEMDSNINISPITKKFIKKIFEYYGEKGREMKLEDFETMLQKLNLTNLALNPTDDSNCSSITDLFDNLYPDVKKKLSKEYDDVKKETPHLANQYTTSNPDYKLTKSNIHSMCPILLYHLISPNEDENVGCIAPENLQIKEELPELSEANFVEQKDTFLIWTYSLIAVVFCGLLGLVGVAIIPFMNTKYYREILSFLVALAVGTMTGDALLHLIPHSVICASEPEMVRKGLVCVLGIIGFYAVENSFTLISEWRKKNRRKTNPKTNVHVVRTIDNNDEDAGAGDKLCKSKYSSNYCYDEIAMDNKDDNNHLNQHPENRDEVHAAVENGNKALQETVYLREHDHTHRGHAHKHGHVHSPPSTISAVAWMIILGDGLHNFTDGMAIGAAFSESIPGGFSTSLAVFCHELPHELGDFAILIKAGMTPKAAVAYNCLTAILSFFGMIFGIVFGENDEASRWMFSVAAGLFIYIALVDMMPEMTSAHNTLRQVFLQLLGLVGGLMSMLLIALYEHELMNIFGGHNHSHSCPSDGGGHGHSHGGHGHSH